ncbi:aspartyl/asparaginyl beta-hydroxylase domain-containing protein [Sphingosinicella terrae]|uniref:aspartyl/asparaginyl beta-hydroxylase domain-containing protein n=1 Tax=Sphingosinicella terrae TaxID=2172047 RepID=UPI002546E78D|nr:aspartyl/asparaginyl beta-hydroxylase domain-containing protein [Sphingosinicella terrae]
MNHPVSPGADTRSIEAEADRAAARGDAPTARRLLGRLTELDPDRPEPWLKLSAMCRATGDLPGALEAVSGALRVDPLGFLPLLLRANILENLGRQEEAGETYGYALAQLPATVPAHLQPMIGHARQRHEAHIAQGAARMAQAAEAAGSGLSASEQARLDRFQSNIVRRTRVYHSEPTHFHYPGLREREFHEREAFPWLAELEASTAAIRDDFQRVVTAEQAELVPYIQYPDDVPLRQWAALNRSRDWTAIHLVQNGIVIEANARHCPATMAILDRLEQPDIPRRGPNAMFSLLAPGAHIPPHTGVANTRLVCHLPLIVPNGCWFRVGAETRPWREGEAWVFDDTIEHEAANPSGALRVILIVDTWHPDLSPAERVAVAAVMAATDPIDAAEGL